MSVYPLSYNETNITDAADQINQAWEEIGEIVHEQVACCRFCGQVRDVSDIKFQYGRDYNEYATRRCNCRHAKLYYESLQRKNMEEDKRRSALAQIQTEIEELFDDIAEQSGNPPVNQEIKDMILQTATLIYDRKLVDASINATYRINVKIQRGKDKLSFKGTDKNVYTREVDE